MTITVPEIPSWASLLDLLFDLGSLPFEFDGGVPLKVGDLSAQIFRPRPWTAARHWKSATIKGSTSSSSG